MRRIGLLMGFAESMPEAQANVAAFRDGLQKLGWTEGRNIRIDTRWATPDDAVPGGNVTGFILMEPTMAGKWPELLKEIAPRVNRVAILFNPATAPYAEYFLNPFKAAAASLAVEAIVAPVREVSELEFVVATQARAPTAP